MLYLNANEPDELIMSAGKAQSFLKKQDIEGWVADTTSSFAALPQLPDGHNTSDDQPINQPTHDAVSFINIEDPEGHVIFAKVTPKSTFITKDHVLNPISPMFNPTSPISVESVTELDMPVQGSYSVSKISIKLSGVPLHRDVAIPDAVSVVSLGASDRKLSCQTSREFPSCDVYLQNVTQEENAYKLRLTQALIEQWVDFDNIEHYANDLISEYADLIYPYLPFLTRDLNLDRNVLIVLLYQKNADIHRLSQIVGFTKKTKTWKTVCKYISRQPATFDENQRLLDFLRELMSRHISYPEPKPHKRLRCSFCCCLFFC